jgi:lambda family phage portal protein
MPRAASGDDKLDRKVDALFERWTADCDADGQLDFYGLQTLICREMVEAGEVLVRRRLRRASDGLAVPLQLQVLEADFLDATKSSNVGAGRIVQGIEFDPVGKRRAYWLHPEHPGDAHGALRGGLDSRPVPATEIAHVYEKQRTQARGVPWGAPVIRSLRDLDDYEVAELVRKKTEACVTAIVFGDDESQQGIAPTVVDADGNRVEQFEPGLIAYARGGKDIRFNQPSATGGYGEYKRASLHTISAGFRVPYELLTGDLSPRSTIPRSGPGWSNSAARSTRCSGSCSSRCSAPRSGAGSPKPHGRRARSRHPTCRSNGRRRSSRRSIRRRTRWRTCCRSGPAP